MLFPIRAVSTILSHDHEAKLLACLYYDDFFNQLRRIIGFKILSAIAPSLSQASVPRVALLAGWRGCSTYSYESVSLNRSISCYVDMYLFSFFCEL